jgi:undecaprenyl diphosphate synthase
MAEFHVAIIMDGNGRWATRRGLPRIAGHRSGAHAVRRTIEAAPDLGISILTLYAFSEDNWNRPPREVAALMKLLARYLVQETDRCIASGVRLEAIGRRDRLPRPLAPAPRDRLFRAPSDCGGRAPLFP